MSAWYWLTYLDGGSHLRVFDHYATANAGPQSAIVQSENTAWRLANQIIGDDADSRGSDQLPKWAWFRTGHDTGPSAGLMFTLAYLDVLTQGALVDNLRVAGTGAIGPDGVVIPVSNVNVKVAAAMLARPDVVFTTTAPESVEHVTLVESHHTRNPTAGYTIFEEAGQLAASHPGPVVVVVHDVRQALAWLCGRTTNKTTCAVAHKSAIIPIGTT